MITDNQCLKTSHSESECNTLNHITPKCVLLSMTTTKHVNKNQEKEDSLLTNVSSLSLPNWAVPHEPQQVLTSALLAIWLSFPIILFSMLSHPPPSICLPFGSLDNVLYNLQ